MLIIVIFIFLLQVLHIKRFIKDSLSRLFLYSYTIYWNVSLIISFFRPYGMASNNDNTYIILLLGMLSFYIGFSTFGNVHSINRFNNNNLLLFNYTDKLVRNKVILSIYAVCSLFALSYARNALVAAELNDGAIMFENRLELIFGGSAFGSLLYNYVLIPMFYFTLTLLSLTLFHRSRKYIPFYVLSCIFLVSYTILAGGRSVFVIMMMYLVITYISLKSLKKRIRIPKKQIGFGFILGILVFIGMSLQTGYRKTGSYSFSGDDIVSSVSDMGEMFMVYSVIPIRLFDVALENDVPEKFGMQYGRATIAGTDEIVCGLIKRITGDKPWSTAEIVKYTQDTWIRIIPGTWGYNYCYTALFYNYIDFGIAGVIILPFIFGFILRYYVFQFLRYRSLPSLILISLGYFMMLHSLFTCYFIKNWVIMFCIVNIVWQYFTNIRPMRIQS